MRFFYFERSTLDSYELLLELPLYSKSYLKHGNDV